MPAKIRGEGRISVVQRWEFGCKTHVFWVGGSVCRSCQSFLDVWGKSSPNQWVEQAPLWPKCSQPVRHLSSLTLINHLLLFITIALEYTLAPYSQSPAEWQGYLCERLVDKFGCWIMAAVSAVSPEKSPRISVSTLLSVYLVGGTRLVLLHKISTQLSWIDSGWCHSGLMNKDPINPDWQKVVSLEKKFGVELGGWTPEEEALEGNN